MSLPSTWPAKPRSLRPVVGLGLSLVLSGCAPRTAEFPPPPVATVRAVPAVPVPDSRPVPVPLTVADSTPAPAPLEVATGEATYYAGSLDGRRTASGVVFRNSEPYAAHRSYPFGTLLRVVNERNGREVLVTVVDRGPHGASAAARRTIIDVSQSAAAELGFIRDGRTPVRLEVLRWGDG
jgi:rare lipoprotein A